MGPLLHALKLGVGVRVRNYHEVVLEEAPRLGRDGRDPLAVHLTDVLVQRAVELRRVRGRFRSRFRGRLRGRCCGRCRGRFGNPYPYPPSRITWL